jgi:hypothetical protein
MASEDSDQLVPGLPAVHRLRDLRYVGEPGRREMPSALHQRDARRELLEVLLLGGEHREGPEERDDHVDQLHPPVDDVLSEVLAMVVVAPINEDASNPEELVELLEAGDALHSLRHGEPMRDLVASLVASAVCAMRLPHEPDGEASLSVYKTDDPATELDQPFLLIFRTRHVVTMVNVRSDVTR